MEFEEFFKRKRIDLDALQKDEPVLFSEFKTHFGLMGEKSFDHTKKYWFNKLRLQFPAAVEIKTEKVKIDNPLAEQTITESLIEETVAPPKLGFLPKFKANIQKSAETDTSAKIQSKQELPAPSAPKLGFTPKFKAANIPKPAAEPEEPVAPEATEDNPTPENTEEKPAYKPRFNMKNLPKKEE